MHLFRKLTAVICILCLLAGCLAGCASSKEEAPAVTQTEAATETTTHPAASFTPVETPPASTKNTGRITGMSLDESGSLQITREPAKSEPMGEKDTWTIFVYLCGSDLESKDGSATDDLQEMIEGSKGSSVRYIVLTGGAMEWQNTLVDGTVLEIYEIADGTMSLVESADYNYMNDPTTLYSFLSWGVANYPAEKMGVILWNHGGGSINGVCVDRRFFDDVETGVLEDISGYNTTLSLPDISGALSQVYDEMTDQFEFVGYDACLMCTLENAFMLSPYSRYLYASEESEPGCGWNYKAIGQAIGKSGKIRGDALGKVVCDSFMEGCAVTNEEANSTLSCIDLSKIDDLVLEFDKLSVKLLDASEDPAKRSNIIQNVNHVEFFGGNSEAEGYFNMVDMASLVNAVSSHVPNSKAVLDALSKAVVYSNNGIYHENACGLSMYYPLHVDSGSGELGQYAKVAVSPYFYGYVAQNAYAAANGGTNGYDLSVSLDAWASAVDPDIEIVEEDYGDAQVTGESPYITFYDGPRLLEDGTYGFSVTEDSLPYISSVEANLFFISDDGEDLVFLGSTTDIQADWENGIFLDNFDGLWYCMPNEQLVSAIVVNETDTYTIYTTPVLLNGEQTNLRFLANADGSVTLDGIWEGADETGMADRSSLQLKPGDVIQPIFNAGKLDSDETLLYYGGEYVYDGDNTWYYTNLFDSDYYYQFCVYDVYGDNRTTDFTVFTVENGEIFFTTEE